MKKLLFGSLIGLLFSTSTAFAVPLPKTSLNALQLPETFTKNYDFEGIIELNNCSGSLVRFDNSQDSDAALVLTNGHCLESGMPKPGQVVVGKASTRTLQLLNTAGKKAATLHAVEVVYATMTRTDIAIYKLSQTYADILSKYEIRPYTLARTEPVRQMNIEIISGYWHRGYSCAIEEIAYRLKEESWTFEDSIRYSRPGCEIIGGTSGSPIIETGTRTVVGINNTVNESGEECTINNPCEIDRNGNVIFEKGYGYGQETYWIYSCLDSKNQIDLSTKGCLLPR